MAHFFFRVVLSIRRVQVKISKNANGPPAPFGCSWSKDPKGLNTIKGYFWLQHQDEEVPVFGTDVTFLFKCCSRNCLQMWGTYFRNTQKAQGGCDQRRVGLILQYHIWRWIFKNTFSLHVYFQRKGSASVGTMAPLCLWASWPWRGTQGLMTMTWQPGSTSDGYHRVPSTVWFAASGGSSPAPSNRRNNKKK